MKKILVLSILVLLFSVIVSGSTVLKVKGSIRYDKLPVNDVTVELYKNGNKESTSVAVNGKFQVDLGKNSKYKIVLSKEGYYTQTINIDTEIYGDGDESWNYRCVVELLPEVKAVKGDIFKESLWNVKYSDTKSKFDNEAIPDLREKLEYFLAKYETAKQTAYENIISEADNAFENQDYQLAARLYENAVILDTECAYPDAQLSRIKRLALK